MEGADLASLSRIYAVTSWQHARTPPTFTWGINNLDAAANVGSYLEGRSLVVRGAWSS